jgi:hypothetical protein
MLEEYGFASAFAVGRTQLGCCLHESLAQIRAQCLFDFHEQRIDSRSGKLAIFLRQLRVDRVGYLAEELQEIGRARIAEDSDALHLLEQKVAFFGAARLVGAGDERENGQERFGIFSNLMDMSPPRSGWDLYAGAESA